MADLKGRSVRGGAITMGSQGVKFAIQLGSTAVLARLLTPADFGLVAMVTAVTGFVAMFKDAGLSMATVQREHITHAQVSTLFWVNLALSTILMGVVAVLAPVIAWAYGEPRLTGITLALAGTFVFGGLTVQHQALLQRQMRFTALCGVELASHAAGVVAAVLAAIYGFGYWSLVIMTAANAFVNAVVAWLLSGWRPGLPSRGSGVRPMLKFGGNLTGASLCNYAARNVDNILIAAAHGATALGMYTKAYAIFMLPFSQVSVALNRVSATMLSRVAPDGPGYQRIGMRIVRLSAFAAGPPSVILFLFAEEIVQILLGSQWLATAPIVKWLTLALLTQITFVGARNMIVAKGRPDLYLKFTVLNTATAILSFLAGLPWGAVGVATCYAITSPLVRAPLLAYFLQISQCLSQRVFYRQIAPLFLGWTFVAATGMATKHILGGLTGELTLATTAITSGVVALTVVATVSVIPAGRAAVADSRALLTTLRKRGGA